MHETPFAKKRACGMAATQGHMALYTGCMMSGKTTAMIAAIDRLTYADRHCLLLCSTQNTRDGDDVVISTHRGAVYRSWESENASVTIVRTDRIASVEIPARVSVVGIDEGQMFEHLVDDCNALLARGLDVHVAALCLDYRDRPFEQVATLACSAEHVERYYAICMMCRAPETRAIFNHRLPGHGDERIVIGGADKYQVLCRACRASGAETT